MIEFKNVTKLYDQNSVALEDVSLKIEDGEFVFIVGQSGAGKTTLTKLLLREEKTTGGDIIVDKTHLRRLNFFTLPYYRRKIGIVFQDFRLFDKMPNYKVPYYRRQLGVVFQDFRLFPNKTVFENVAFAMRVVGESRRSIAKKVPLILRVVGLENKRDRFPASLSGGEQQRVALARALANNPKYIIADEPTGNVDPELSREIMEMLLKICRMKKTVIVVTHEKALVEQFGQRVITISRGHVVSDTGRAAAEEG